MNGKPIDHNELGKILLYDAVIQAVKHYGIEGTEDVIKRVYRAMPIARDAMLKAFKEIYLK